jgi:acylphosphatase
MDSTLIIRAVIRGRVQGVGYRAWIHHQAELRGLQGWVRNSRDGSVEALFSGPAEAVRAMLEACQQGPASARVDAVDTGDADETALARLGSGRFEVLPTT